MLAYATPPTFEVPESGNLTDDVLAAVAARPDAVAFTIRDGDTWRDTTITQFRDEVVKVARGFLAAGVNAGDRVALLSRTRYEWTVVDYAIWWAGAVTVPVYETSSAEQIRWILSDSGAVACVVEDDALLARVTEARAGVTTLGDVWTIEDEGLVALAARGAEVSDEDLEKRRSSVAPSCLATVIYTSGTTGRPKGCCLTHANLMFELGVATQALDDLFDTTNASTLLFLPLAHVFARIIQVGCIRSGARLGHTSDVKNLVDSLSQFEPTFILAVPRVFEKVFNTASQKAHSEGRGRIFDAAAEVAIAYSRALETDGRAGPLLRAKRAVLDRLVYAKLRAALGGHVQYAVSGGAPLGDRLAHFFRGIGLPVLEGYGLTETTAALTVNLPGEAKIGTVGRPIPGTEVRVGDDGELLFRGGQVFERYWNDQEATASIRSVDGWLHTGDVGEIDHEGFVRITGRKKEIIVTAGGKNVAPAAMEDRIRSHSLVSQCMVVGDGKPFIAALVTLDDEAFQAWRAGNNKSGDLADLVSDPDLVARIQEAVDDANRLVSKAESIRKFTILPQDWTEEAGHVTPTMKLKRNVVTRDFHADIEALFDS